jgi:hypothetical protein
MRSVESFRANCAPAERESALRQTVASQQNSSRLKDLLLGLFRNVPPAKGADGESALEVEALPRSLRLKSDVRLD